MYRLFYNHEVTGDLLLILIDPEKKVDRHVAKDGVVALYNGEEIVGYNIFSISKIMKIRNDGIIFAPKDEMIDIINNILSNAGFSPLPYCHDSGYKVARISNLEEHPVEEKAQIVTLSLGDKELTTVSYYKNLEVGKFIVVAVEGTILYNGEVFHNYESRKIPIEANICSRKELRLEDEASGAFLLDEGVEGSDFFLN
ncbi:MAG: DUF4479 domain-containing protein [Bacilli bacterium]|nr:DUF4479 domain-containing protein [Bacilli bacterium]